MVGSTIRYPCYVLWSKSDQRSRTAATTFGHLGVGSVKLPGRDTSRAAETRSDY